MIVTMWVDGQNYEIQSDQVVPWICGINGCLDSFDIGLDRPVTVDVDPSEPDRPGGITYLVEVGGVQHTLSESWVLPWVHGLIVRHGITDQVIADPSTAERAQRVQALMVGHQLGLFVYTGFTHREKL
jgi:hypothetical protein